VCGLLLDARNRLLQEQPVSGHVFLFPNDQRTPASQALGRDVSQTGGFAQRLAVTRAV
jgi:hypothetical protein